MEIIWFLAGAAAGVIATLAAFIFAPRAGALKIYHGDPDGIYMCLELHKRMGALDNKKAVVLDVVHEDIRRAK